MPDAAPDQNFSDEYADFVLTHTLDILKLSTGIVSDVKAQLREIEATIVAAIERHVEATGPINKGELRSLLADVQDELEERYGKIANDNDSHVADVIEHVVDAQVYVVNSSVGAPLFKKLTKPQIQEAIESNFIKGMKSQDWWEKQGQALQDRFTQQMRMGFLSGESIPDLVKRVRGTKAMNYNDGIMQVSKRQAEALVRTSILGASNNAMHRLYTANTDAVKGYQWVATLDTRTCPVCRALDGGQYTLDYKPVGRSKNWPGVPPVHYNCRCVLIAVLKSWKELNEEGAVTGPRGGNAQGIEDHVREYADKNGWKSTDTEDHIERLRQSMDGKVSANLDFDGWLKTKSEKEQDDMLGADRAAIWRDKGLSLYDLTNSDNRVLTIDQLRAKYGSP